MWNNSRKDLADRIAFLPQLANDIEVLRERWQDNDILLAYAQERLLHLAIETVTDIGSLLIDAFILRDAGSYEDIVAIMADEQAVDGTLARQLHQLVAERKALVQDYVALGRSQQHPLLAGLADQLLQVAEQVRRFIAYEDNRLAGAGQSESFSS